MDVEGGRGVGHPGARDGAATAPLSALAWRWRTVADPCRPKGHRMPHPLAGRVGAPCRLLAQGRNGNRLIEFEDGLLVVAPFYATRAAG